MTIVFSRDAQKALFSLPRDVQRRIVEAIDALCEQAQKWMKERVVK